jgi:hypothetical protein
VAFGPYTIRCNRYAARIAHEGITLVHEGPAARSLAEIPEVDLERVTIRRARRPATSKPRGSPGGIQPALPQSFLATLTSESMDALPPLLFIP